MTKKGWITIFVVMLVAGGVFGLNYAKKQGVLDRIADKITPKNIQVKNDESKVDQALNTVFITKGSSTLAKAMVKVAETYKKKTGIEVGVVSASTGDGFKALKSGEAVVAMASRPIKLDENVDLGGNMTSSTNEFVVGVDAIAFVVNKSNYLEKITKPMIKKILAGEVKRWNQVPGSNMTGDIHVYGYGEKSGITEIIKSAILGKDQMAPIKMEAKDGDEETKFIQEDQHGFGFVSLIFKDKNKPLAVADDNGLDYFFPNRFTVQTESYPVTRRLYLYVAQPNSEVMNFIDFVTSDEGQKVIGEKFIPLTVATAKELEYDNSDSPIQKNYPRASRLSTDFRFQTGSSDPDNKASADIKRVVKLLEADPNKKILLFGFADNIGGKSDNITLSERRAKAIADIFLMNGINPETIRGYGSDYPIASNENSEGREKNRRVEIWIK